MHFHVAVANQQSALANSLSYDKWCVDTPSENESNTSTSMDEVKNCHKQQLAKRIVGDSGRRRSNAATSKRDHSAQCTSRIGRLCNSIWINCCWMAMVPVAMEIRKWRRWHRDWFNDDTHSHFISLFTLIWNWSGCDDAIANHSRFIYIQNRT